MLGPDVKILLVHRRADDANVPTLGPKRRCTAPHTFGGKVDLLQHKDKED